MSYFIEEQAEENERFAETIRHLRSRVLAADMAMLDMSGARDRYRLAWMSARRRATDERGSHAMTASSFEIFIESMKEQAQAATAITDGLRAQLADAQDSAIRHADRHREIFEAHLRQVAELTDERDQARNAAGDYAVNEFRLIAERDEARAEVVRLGCELEALKTASGMEPHEQLGVRVDQAHPTRKEKVGDVMTHLAEESARYAPKVWAGWTLVRRTVIHHETPWVEVPDA